MNKSAIKTEFKQTFAFTARNIRLFFKDKGMFISALISPLVIMLLYVLFLHSVLSSTFEANLPEGMVVADSIISGYIAAYEISSILAVCCVTVAFVANMAMVDDRVSGVKADLTVSPVKGRALVLGYYLATAAVTLIICYVAMLVGFVYIVAMGWQMSALDVFAVMLDVFLASLFGTALSSVVCFFLKSRGAINAVSTIVSTVYGFISGAYYPISQFSKGIGNTVMCLPGTYCTALFRTHFMGAFGSAFDGAGFPAAVSQSLLESLDAKMYFFGSEVKAWAMYTVVCCSIVALVALFVALNAIRKPKKLMRNAK